MEIRNLSEFIFSAGGFDDTKGTWEFTAGYGWHSNTQESSLIINLLGDVY